MYRVIEYYNSKDKIRAANIATIGETLDSLIEAGVKKPFKAAKKLLKRKKNREYNGGEYILEITPLKRGYTLFAKEWKSNVIFTYTTHGKSIEEVVKNFHDSDFRFSYVEMDWLEDDYLYDNNTYTVEGDKYEITLIRVD